MYLLVIVAGTVGHGLVAGGHPHVMRGTTQFIDDLCPSPVLIAGAVRDKKVPRQVGRERQGT